MIKQLLKAGAVTAVAVSVAALPNAAQAARFQALDFSGILPIGSLSPGSQLLGPTPYFDGPLGQLGTFTVTLVGRGTGSPIRPVGNASGDLTNAATSPGSISLRIAFTPLANSTGQLPIVRLSQTSAPAGTGVPTAFNPFQANTESYSVVTSGGTATGWGFSRGTLAPGVTPNNSAFFVNNASGTNAAWTFNNTQANPAASNTIPFQYDSNGRTGFLDITYSSSSTAFNAATLNIRTASEIPEPATAIGSIIALALGMLSSRSQKGQDSEE